MRLALVIPWAWAVLLAPAVADAQAEVRERVARRHFARAEGHFARGRYDEAFREYETAYAIAPLPALFFNMAQCQRKLENRERAVHFFRRYLEEVPDAENRAVVEDLLRELGAPAGTAAEQPALGDPREATLPPPPEPRPPPSPRPADQRPEPRGGSVSFATWLALGSGAALAIAGGVFALETSLQDARVRNGLLLAGGGVFAVGLVLLTFDLTTP